MDTSRRGLEDCLANRGNEERATCGSRGFTIMGDDGSGPFC